jgi:hypothetical protein
MGILSIAASAESESVPSWMEKASSVNKCHQIGGCCQIQITFVEFVKWGSIRGAGAGSFRGVGGKFGGGAGTACLEGPAFVRAWKSRRCAR